MSKQIFVPKIPQEMVLEQYHGNHINDLKDFHKEGLLIRHFNGEDYVWVEQALIWMVLTPTDYIEQLPDGTFNRRHSVEIDESLEVKK